MCTGMNFNWADECLWCQCARMLHLTCRPLGFSKSLVCKNLYRWLLQRNHMLSSCLTRATMRDVTQQGWEHSPAKTSELVSQCTILRWACNMQQWYSPRYPHSAQVSFCTGLTAAYVIAAKTGDLMNAIRTVHAWPLRKAHVGCMHACMNKQTNECILNNREWIQVD